MRRICTAVAAVLVTLALPALASANYVDQERSDANCVQARLVLTHFDRSDGPVNWIVQVDGQPNTAGATKAFEGEKTLTQAYAPGPLVGPGSHTVVFRASWDGKVQSFTKVVPNCPVAKPPVPPTPPLPCPDQPPTAPCNCPPGEKGKDGTTTVITVIEKQETVKYVEKTCTSHRVFNLTIAQRVPRDDVLGEDSGQKIVRARIVWRGANAAHENVTKKATAKLRVGRKGETDRGHARLRVNASFNNVVTTPGVTRVIDEYDTLANGHVLHFTREIRLCVPFRDGDLNGAKSLPQNGHANGAEEAGVLAPRRGS